jgi:acetylserotonin N-methyltransferase
MPEPTPAPPSDRRIYDAYIAARQSAALAAAVRVGLFDILAGGPRTPAELARALGVEVRPLTGLVRALLHVGLLESAGGAIALAPDAACYLVRGRDAWLGALIDLEVENFLTPEMVVRALAGGGASVYGGADPWLAHAADPARARAFTSAMHSISAVAAPGLASAVELRGARRLLDVGGGSGVHAAALARAWPELECTVWEIPAIAALAQLQLESEPPELARRVRILPGDFWRDAWPGGFDAVLFSQILHDWPPEKGRWLLERARAALAPGGRVLIHEKLVADDGSGPLANALVDIDMIVWTEGQQYSRERLAALLAQAGFAAPRFRPGHGYWTVTEAGF